VDARDWVTTDDSFGSAKVHFDESKLKLQQLATQWGNRLPVITGFIGKARNGRTTTLGRNGSDYTATLVGAALQADYVIINTDISGVMTADPRIVERAVALSHLNHHEALELAVYGTRMFHARTMVPLIHGGVTMLIRNTMDPNGHGTYISSADNTGKPETCTTSLENLAILEVRTRILQDASQNAQENIGARITKVLETQKIPVWLSIRGAHGQAISVVIPVAMLSAASAAIREELQTELENDEVDPVNAQSPVTMLSIVAEDFSKIPFNQAKFFAALADSNIEVLAVGQGTSSRSLSCVIHGRDTKIAVRRVHDAFNVDFLVSNVILLGCNRVRSVQLGCSMLFADCVSHRLLSYRSHLKCCSNCRSKPSSTGATTRSSCASSVLAREAAGSSSSATVSPGTSSRRGLPVGLAQRESSLSCRLLVAPTAARRRTSSSTRSRNYQFRSSSTARVKSRPRNCICVASSAASTWSYLTPAP
jgi:aspartate kinase